MEIFCLFLCHVRAHTCIKAHIRTPPSPGKQNSPQHLRMEQKAALSCASEQAGPVRTFVAQTWAAVPDQMYHTQKNQLSAQCSGELFMGSELIHCWESRHPLSPLSPSLFQGLHSRFHVDPERQAGCPGVPALPFICSTMLNKYLYVSGALSPAQWG